MFTSQEKGKCLRKKGKKEDEFKHEGECATRAI